MKKLVYIETSVISFLTSKPSRDLIVAAYQKITSDWWYSELLNHECFISDFVIEEISRGDSVAAQKRLQAVSNFKYLALNDLVQDLVIEYTK